MKLREIEEFTSYCASSFPLNVEAERVTSLDLQYKRAKMTRVMLIEVMENIAQILINSGAGAQFQKTVAIYKQIPQEGLLRYLAINGSCLWDYWMLAVQLTIDKDRPEEEGYSKQSIEHYRIRYANHSVTQVVNELSESLNSKIEAIQLMSPIDQDEIGIKQALHGFRVAAILTLFEGQEGYEEQFPELVNGIVNDIKIILEKAIIDCINSVQNANTKLKSIRQQGKRAKKQGFGKL